MIKFSISIARKPCSKSSNVDTERICKMFTDYYFNYLTEVRIA